MTYIDTTTASRAKKFIVGTQGVATVTIATESIRPYEAAKLTPGTYSLSLNIDGGGAADVLFVVPALTTTWNQIIDAMNKIVTGAEVSLDGVKLTVTSATYGTSSSVVIADGSTGDGGFLALLTAAGLTNTINTPVVGVDDLRTIGYAEITNTGTLGAFVGATVPAIASATYDLDVTVDDGTAPEYQLAIALLNTDDWDGIATKIETALQTATGSTETVAIVSGAIRITSATSGENSGILIQAGTAGSGGGDLLAAITALSADYTATLATPVDGTDSVIFIYEEGASATNLARDVKVVYDVVSSTGVSKKDGTQVEVDRVNGRVVISSGTTFLSEGDVVTATID